MNQQHDIDVFAEAKKAKLALDHLPDVESCPVLPHMRKVMDVDLAVNADGRVYVFYDGTLPEDVEYALYSIDDSTLHLVGYNGRLQDIGMKVHKPMRKYMRTSDNIYIIEMKQGVAGNVVNIRMITHEIGI